MKSDTLNKKIADMKVTEVEVHQITLEFLDWLAYQFNHQFQGRQRTVYVVHTDEGLTGLGESPGGPLPQEVIDRYIGTNPFDMKQSKEIGWNIAYSEIPD